MASSVLSQLRDAMPPPTDLSPTSSVPSLECAPNSRYPAHRSTSRSRRNLEGRGRVRDRDLRSSVERRQNPVSIPGIFAESPRGEIEASGTFDADFCHGFIDEEYR